MPESEAAFQSWLTDMLALYGWRLLHEDAPYRCHKCGAYQKPRKVAGLPDIIAARGNRLLFAELKSERGRVRPEQQEVIDALAPVTLASVVQNNPDGAPRVRRGGTDVGAIICGQQ